MNKFLRWYYKNKWKFWLNVLIALGVYLIILLLNRISIKSTEGSNTNNSINTSYINSGTIKNDKTIIGTQTETKKIEEANTVIEDFVEYCNSGEIESAYSLLTQNCKEEMFPTLNDFEKAYYNRIFKTEKTYKMQNWSGNTYKVEYRNSLMATGGTETNEFIRDYITTEKEKDEVKLNINNYIGRTNIEKTKKTNEVEIKVISKDTYMDYEIYNLEVTNSSKNDVLLDSLEYSTSIFIKDENDKKHYAFANELTKEMLTVKINQKKTISIKFTNSYITNRKYSSMNFSKFITNINQMENTGTINIEL